MEILAVQFSHSFKYKIQIFQAFNIQSLQVYRITLFIMDQVNNLYN